MNLTQSQQDGLVKFVNFLNDPDAKEMQITGCPGTGKSFLVNACIEEYEKQKKLAKILDVDYKEECLLAATTNQAASNLTNETGLETKTIHSLLGLTIIYKEGKEQLIDKNPNLTIIDTLVFLDEYSYLTNYIVSTMFLKMINCKVVFIGDDDQLKFPNATFNLSVPDKYKVELTESTRFKDTALIELRDDLQIAVRHSKFSKIKFNDTNIISMGRAEFNSSIDAEFTRPDWHIKDSRIIGWRNKNIIGYNQSIRTSIGDTEEYNVGDQYIVNKHVTSAGRKSIPTEGIVTIVSKHPYHNPCFDLHELMVNYNGHSLGILVPKDRTKHALTVKALSKNKAYSDVTFARQRVADLRYPYASTVYKAQGSSFKNTYVDLLDMYGCRQKNTLARMVYVAATRAREKIYICNKE